MKENKLVDLSVEFAVEILRLSYFLQQQKKETIISNQIGSSGTSIGANIHEAQYAQSKADFVHKLQIALKETNETGYWLQLISKVGLLELTKCDVLIQKCTAIRAMLIASIKTAKIGTT